jgi:hypothetical protein
VFDVPSSARLRVDLQEFADGVSRLVFRQGSVCPPNLSRWRRLGANVLNDSGGILEDTNMKEEVENALRKTERGKYLAEACKSDPELAEAVESAYADGARAERERQLAIDRAGGPDAFKAAELLAWAMQRVRTNQ